GLQHVDDSKSQTGAQRTAGQSEQRTLGEHLAEKLRPPRSQGTTHRVFLPPPQPASQQQARDISAGDEEHQCYGSQQRQKEPASFAIQKCGEWLDGGGDALKIMGVLRLSSSNRGHFRL